MGDKPTYDELLSALQRCPQYITVAILDARERGMEGHPIWIAENDLAHVRDVIARASEAPDNG